MSHEEYPYALIPTVAPSPTPTPSPTPIPIVGWLQNNVILIVVLFFVVLFFFMMRRISFPGELFGQYVDRILGQVQALGSMSIPALPM
jgi:hypothetical protein